MLNSAPRKGLTLLEVLITIFVMAIGFLSVLTLFPLAARKLARSIDSDRATLMAANASSAARILGYRDMAQSECNLELIALPAGSTDRLRPSTVIHVDPVGVAGNALPKTGFTRLPTVPLPLNSFREWLVSQDEMRFESTGLPEQSFRRAERYSCSFLFRRQQLNDPKSLECLVLVYAGRPIEFGNSTDTLLNVVSGTSGLSDLTVTDPGPGPGGPDRSLLRSSWIMDLSPDGGNPSRPRWKKFYQVQSVEGSGVPGTPLALTLDRAIEQDITVAVWVDFLFDWFDRGILP
jgi:prepilin-type N-terminal cleavage/methylation domain-containing protein